MDVRGKGDKQDAVELRDAPDIHAWAVVREMTDIRQDEEMQALSEEIQKEYERRREERRSIELGWRLNQNFLMGNQYCDVLYETGELIEEVQGAEWENRAVYNMIAPIVETRLAKLSRVRPGMTVRPLTEDAADIANARLATRLLKASYADVMQYWSF